MPPVIFDRSEVRERLYRHVEALSVRIGERHLWKPGSLDASAHYIESAFRESGYRPDRQTFRCYGRSVSNILAERPGGAGGIWIVGAHYDAVPGSPGADDNASAVAGLLELARLAAESGKGDKRLLFAAFVNEESPCFGTPNMGSVVCARDLKSRGARLEVMISLEMIGFFSREAMQRYPLPGMDLFYPKRGDFLGVVGNFASFRQIRIIRRKIARNAGIDVRSLVAPPSFGGIGLSDHSSFWRFGYPAVMVTDTAFYRNPHYHQESDTIGTLNFEAMTEVVRGLHHALCL